MGLFGSLFTGVSALFSQSQNTAIISNNIANISTTGFKRSEAAFESLVTSQSRLSTYSPGTVTVNRLQRVDQQGALQQTASTTDAAISGNGFFAVKRDPDNTQEFLYTRAGQFSEDSQGLLRNAAGFALYAWPIDANGSLPANQGDLTSLVPADVAFLGGLTRPTSSAELAINLDANAVDQTLSSALTSAVDFSRGITVFDSLGSSQVLTFEYTKVYGPQATAAGTIGDLQATDELVNDLGLTVGNEFEISSELGGPLTLTVVSGTPTVAGEIQTVNDIITEINNAGLGVSASLGNDGELIIRRDEFTGGAVNTLTLENTVGVPLTGLGITLTANPQTFTGDDLTLTGDYDNGTPADTPPYSTGDALTGHTFPAFQFLPGDAQYNDRGWWQLNIVHPDGTSLSRGLLNFNGDGTLNSIPDNDGNTDINLSQIDWNNGSEAQNINIDIERFSQFSGNFDVIFSDQNGAELGLRTGVEIDRDGFIIARFSNGASATLYKMPLITFANSNGLTEVSGTAYSENSESGEENLREAGTGGAGFIEPSTLEASNVDLADEFARLIVSQRAFGAGTRLINTVDQMTQDLLSLRN
ncbi:MAG: flagellar hook-basal body complex protein [Alphaproteobacteria bacterium]|nr:flagellar hook-basal body complex protein [Alphaproteobacteria bacterium]